MNPRRIKGQSVVITGAASGIGEALALEFAARGGNGSRLPWRDGAMRTICGTSFSAPVATGLIARILSVHPGIHPDQMKMILRDIAEPAEP